MWTEPHLHCTLVGIVWGAELGPQYPRRTGTMFNLAKIIPPWMECATSLHLDTETNVTVTVTDDDERLEAHALTGGGLLLHGANLHHLMPGSEPMKCSTIWCSLMGKEKR